MYRNVFRTAKCNRRTGKWAAESFSLVLAVVAAICLFPSAGAGSTSTTTTTMGPIQRGNGYQRPPQRSPKRTSIDLQVERVSKRLDLSELQRFDLKKLLANQRAQSDRLWNDQQISPMDRMTQLRALHESTQKQFRALLTREQRKKYDDLLQQVSPQSAPQQENAKSAH